MKFTHRFGFITVLFLIVLLASFMLNYFLFIQSRRYYLQLNETRLDPLGLSYYPSDIDQQNFTDLDKTTIVFFGDSRAANWPPPLNLPEYEFINRGIDSQTSAQVLQRFNYHIKSVHPQVIIIQVCINDLKAIPLFLSRKEAIIANCKENIQHIATKSNAIGATVILTTIFPIGKVPLERRLFWSPDIAQAINEVNVYIYSLEAQDIIIFDAYQILVDDGVTREEYTQDLLHLNSTGYEALNHELAHILATLE